MTTLKERCYRILAELYPFRGEEFYYPIWHLLRHLEDDNLKFAEYDALLDELYKNGYAVVLHGKTDFTTHALKITPLGVAYFQKVREEKQALEKSLNRDGGKDGQPQ
jgi:DNA-binding MarR family transcriptional regulator